MADRARTNRIRRFGVGLVLALLMTGVILLPGATTTSAQSGGGFAGAILELVPNTGTSLSTATAGAAGGAFVVQGTVLRNRTVSATCSISGLGNTSVHDDEDGGVVGTWRMWGVRISGPVTTGATGDILPTNSISAGNVAVVNMSVTLFGFNGTLEFQGTLGRTFGSIESAGHLASDILAITGGTGTFRAASGDAILTPLVTNATITGNPPFPVIPTQCPATSAAAGGFQLFLREGFKSPRFTNTIP